MSETDSADFGVETIEGDEPACDHRGPRAGRPPHGAAAPRGDDECHRRRRHLADRRPLRRDVRRLDDARRAARRRQAAPPARRQGRRRLRITAHPEDLRDHAARPRLRASRDARRRAAGSAIAADERPGRRAPAGAHHGRVPGARRVPRRRTLVLGGVAARFELPVDRVDDLLLGVDSLLMQGVVGEVARARGDGERVGADRARRGVPAGTAGRCRRPTGRRPARRHRARRFPRTAARARGSSSGCRVARRDGA